MFEWDEAKRQANIVGKGLDFLDAVALFDGRQVSTAPSKYPLEDRFVSTALFTNGKFYSVVWTWRADVQRIISFRRAWNVEEGIYRQIFGG